MSRWPTQGREEPPLPELLLNAANALNDGRARDACHDKISYILWLSGHLSKIKKKYFKKHEQITSKCFSALSFYLVTASD